ncbi:Riboflavin kinase [Escovopsis weberi]|uniref:Riboflavin kinase n=1 Tax=Escovopsis weberi TaxID=150374 RepID=A0A0M8N2G9_ESCWE|nr:Riboflavin kinase [Escovopsis weberi]
MEVDIDTDLLYGHLRRHSVLSESEDDSSDAFSDVSSTQPSSPTLPPRHSLARNSTATAAHYFQSSSNNYNYTTATGPPASSGPYARAIEATEFTDPFTDPLGDSAAAATAAAAAAADALYPSSPAPGDAGPEQLRRVKSFSGLSTSSFVSSCSFASAPPEMTMTIPTTPTTGTGTGTGTSLGEYQDGEGGGPSRWKAALEEAQYLAGGLVAHPAESNRHYTVIRHSHALVWYHGPSTSVAVTVLSSIPLPAQRSLWLQQKGFSGDVGMSLKALAGTTGRWIDVTPERRAGADGLPEADERGIQRDLRRFAKKAAGKQRAHVPRETHVVRIPAAASDGYFRLVVCEGPESRRVLCGSPVFRVASTSMDASVLRGASLGTLPLEVGVKVASTIGQAVVDKYTGVAQTVVNQHAGKLAAAIAAPATVAAAATAATATNTSTAAVAPETERKPDEVNVWDAMSQRWVKAREKNAAAAAAATPGGDMTASLEDTGPKQPFPVEFSARVARGTGNSMAELGIPTANLVKVTENIKMMTLMGGVFAAWARVTKVKDPAVQQQIDRDWHEAIVTIGPSRHAPPQVAIRTSLAMHIIHDFGGLQFVDAKVTVLVMGYLHAAAPLSASVDELVVELSRDVAATLAILGRQAWQPMRRGSLDDRTRAADGAAAAESADWGAKVAGALGKIPFHLAGVRTEADSARDKEYGRGGIWISRDS